MAVFHWMCLVMKERGGVNVFPGLQDQDSDVDSSHVVFVIHKSTMFLKNKSWFY